MEIVGQARHSVEQQLQIIKEEIQSLPVPDVYTLNRRSTLQISAAVAVDAGQSLFGGILREMGIMLLQVASSEDDDPKSYAFWLNPILKDEDKAEQVKEQFDLVTKQDEMIKDFVVAMRWQSITDKEVMPPGCYQQISSLGDFSRELIEWSKLRMTALELKKIYERIPNIQPVILRDGILRFDHMAEAHTKRLSEIFKEIGIPLLGIAKTSKLLANPLISMWLNSHGTFSRQGAFVVKLNSEIFENLNFSLTRYFGDDEKIRFGKYVIVRFDPLPGSKNILAVDVPHFYFDSDASFDRLLVILSGISEHSTATSYPTPGYPYALKKAHERVVFTQDKIYLIENTLRRQLPLEAYEMLKSLET
jgi:hypothetical protein